jgi:hypothetical protein
MTTNEHVIDALRSRANLQDTYGQRVMETAAGLIEEMAAEISTAEAGAHTIETLQAEVTRLENLLAERNLGT